jgi:hypothetical protein
MKKLILLTVAGLTTVSLLPYPAMAGVAKNLDAKGKMVTFGHAPGADVVYSLDMFEAKKAKANACGIGKLTINDGYAFFAAPLTGASAARKPALDAEPLSSLPVATVPTCTGSTPSATVPAIFKTAAGEVYKTGFGPNGTYYTGNGTTNPSVQIKSKANACGVAKHNITKAITAYNYANAGDWSGQVWINGVNQSELEWDGGVFTPTSYGYSLVAPVCVKTSLYVPAPN